MLMNPTAYRLPRTVLPRHYSVEIDARVGTPDLRGLVSIQLEITQPCASIELHARDLEIMDATVEVGGRVLAGAVSVDPIRELLIIQLTETLAPGPATLRIQYLGQVSSTDLNGMFLASNGRERMICTHCEPVGARAVLPCFDEPDFKARFTWQVTTAPDAVVLTNSQLTSVSESDDGSAKTWNFAATPPLSTYLIAIGIGDLAATPQEVVNGVPIRVWASAGKERTGEFALHYVARLLPWYDDYFAVPYHFGKLDELAVSNFEPGAMENAGLIMSRDTLLLMDPETTSWQQEKNVVRVVAHEFAHMWFGDLVTMRWWDDIWLNEAFANWMAFRAIDAISPDYDIWDSFRVRAAGVFETDALAGTHPIYQAVATPQAIQENFDGITYYKGCAVLRMVERYIGQDAFRTGLRTYMREFAEANASGSDLWRHLQAASQEPVTQIMESWILQPGHPIVEVEFDQDTSSLLLRQRRFFLRTGAGAGNEQVWSVPLVIRYQDNAGLHETRCLLSERVQTLPLQVSGKLEWCYANAGEIGFYRQQMSHDLVNSLLHNLNKLEPAEQLGLFRDQWSLVSSGAESVEDFLDVLATMAHSDDYRILQQVSSILGVAQRIMEDAGGEPALENFRAFVAATFGPKLLAVGFLPQAGETEAQALVRCLVIDAMTRYAHDPAAVEQAQVWASRESEDPRAVDANLAPIFVGAAAQFGNDALQERYLAIYQQRTASAASPQEVARYVSSFPRFHQPEMVQHTFDWMSEGIFPFRDVSTMLSVLIGQSHTGRAAWDFMKSHWAYLEKVGGALIPRYVQDTGRLPADLRSDILEFYADHLHGELKSSVALALEQIDQRAELQARTQDGMLAWFSQR